MRSYIQLSPPLIDPRAAVVAKSVMEQRSESQVKLREPAMITAEERRSEPRIEAGAAVVITPLAAVGTRFYGSVVNVSKGGVRVHCDTQLKELPRAGEVCRIQSRGDIILCEVRNSAIAEAGADLGLQIVQWGNAGELKHLLSESGCSSTRPALLRFVMAT